MTHCRRWLPVLLTLVLSAPVTPVSGIQGPGAGGCRKASDLFRAPETGPGELVEIVDGEFKKGFPIRVSMETCDGTAVELKGTCHIEGIIEDEEGVVSRADVDAIVSLYGEDRETGIPYGAEFGRQLSFSFERSSFDLLLNDQILALGTEKVGKISIAFTFSDGRLKAGPVKAALNCQ